MSLLPPFFGGLMAYDAEANVSFACPGHQGGEFYRKSPAGQLFFKHFGEQIFRNDLCNADVDLGDLLIHVGAAVDAQRHAAQVFGADRTYFVLNGTSTSNKVVAQAALRRGDLVLFDRNNHKSLHQGALVQGGRDPDLPADGAQSVRHDRRGRLGRVGREVPARADPHESAREGQERAQGGAAVPARVHPARDLRRHGLQRPQGAWRRSATSATTCCGTRPGSATTPSIRCSTDHSPMRLENLRPEMAGLFSTQSVHKQGAGFSQASQIHKRDEHIRGQRRFIEHKRFNESFLMHCSTSPFYPLFASLDVNAKLHEGKAGEMLWDRCIELGIEARKKLREFGRHYAKTGRDAAGEVVLRSVRARRRDDSRLEAHEGRDERRAGRTCRPTSSSASSNAGPSIRRRPGTATPATRDGYAMVDPNKLMLLTPGIDRKTGEYLDFGVPATVLANYLREQRIVPEKCDLNSILFLMTPAEDESKLNTLIAKLVKFKNLWDRDAPLGEVLPTLYAQNSARYAGYSLRQVCKEMHDFYREANVKELQKQCFRASSFPELAMSPKDAYEAWSRTRWTTCRSTRASRAASPRRSR